MNRVTVRFKVNGKHRTVQAHPMERLLDVLREQLKLTGTKEGCGEGECGACSIVMNGEVVNSCLVPAIQAQGSELTTIEGVNHGVQKAFLECGGAQCGICTPGMVVASVCLLKKHRKPTEDQIREGLAGNICRCTGYMKIFDAVKKASKGATR